MKVVKDTVIYFVTTILNQSIPFVLIPIITQEFSNADVGALSLFNIFNLIFSTVTAFSLNAYLQYIYYRKKEEVPVTIFNILLVSLVANIVLGLINVFILKNVVAYIDIPIYYAWWIPISSFFSLIYFLYLILLRNEGKAQKYGVLSTIMTISNFGLSLYLIYTTDLLWESRAIPAMILPILFGFYTFYLLIKEKQIQFSIDKGLIKTALVYSLPFLGIVLLRQVLDFSDRYILDYFCGKANLGIYDMGYKIGMLVYVAINSFHLVFVPKVYEYFSALEKEPSDALKYKIVTMFHAYFIIIVCITGAVLLTGKFLFAINYIDPKFADSAYIVLPIAISYLFYGLYTVSGVIIGQTFKNMYNLYVVTIGIVVNLGLNIMYIPKYGGMAAAWSTFITFVVMYVITFIMATKIISLPWFKVCSIKHSIREFKLLLGKINLIK